LLFRVTTPVASPFPATAETPEGEKYPEINDEKKLQTVISEILKRERTKEMVIFLRETAPGREGAG
jgi:hypothetical protein